jgi:hypothetical protein
VALRETPELRVDEKLIMDRRRPGAHIDEEEVAVRRHGPEAERRQCPGQVAPPLIDDPDARPLMDGVLQRRQGRLRQRVDVEDRTSQPRRVLLIAANEPGPSATSAQVVKSGSTMQARVRLTSTTPTRLAQRA